MPGLQKTQVTIDRVKTSELIIKGKFSPTEFLKEIGPIKDYLTRNFDSPLKSEKSDIPRAWLSHITTAECVIHICVKAAT